MYNIFIYSFVDRHLGCFSVLPVVNSATMNTGMHVSFESWFSLVICPGVGLLGHMVVLLPSWLSDKESACQCWR